MKDMQENEKTIPAPLQRVIGLECHCSLSIPVRATVQIGSTIYGRRFELNGEPLIGDDITVWDETKSGLIVTVIGREWDSRSGSLSLRCKFAYEINHERLREGGWC